MSERHFTLISPNYAPEDTAIGLYNTHLCDFLTEKAMQVSVITGFPYYPAWEIHNAYLNKKTFHTEKRTKLSHRINPINIFRYKQYVPKKPTFLKRILHLCDFTFGSFINLFKIKKSHIIFAVVPFTTTPLLGLILAKLKGAVLWVHIQDFEFDAARESGLATGKKKILFDILFKIEKYLLSKADIVSSISYAMCDKITEKTGRTDTYFLPNWVDENDINPDIAQKHAYFEQYHDKFTVLYSGNIGAKQDWDIFIEAAKKLENHQNIQFIIVGDGSYKETLCEKTKDLTNIVYFPPVDFSDLNNLLCSANMHILTQKSDVIDTVMPSKILAMFASAKPSLVTGNAQSEVATLFNKSQAGYFISSNQSDDIVNAILETAADSDKAHLSGVNARHYIIENFSKKPILEKFYEKLTIIQAE